MKWASSHHLLVVCFQASVLSVVVQLPGPVQVSYFLPKKRKAENFRLIPEIK